MKVNARFFWPNQQINRVRRNVYNMINIREKLKIRDILIWSG